MSIVPRITELRFAAFDVPLRVPFGIATGAQEVANNVLVWLTLDDGTEGLGEAAPFPAVNAETQAQVLDALPEARRALVGLDAVRYRVVSQAAREVLGHVPSARAAIEMALLDALCRRTGQSMWSFFGGAETGLTSDITIPTGSAENAAAAARAALRDGFFTLKVKVGGAPLEHDCARLLSIVEAAPKAELVLDANASLTERTALELLDAIDAVRARVVLFEQPTAAEDLLGLRRVEEQSGIPVAADESARSLSDVVRLVRERAASVINIKLMKTGLFEAWEMATLARAHGLSLMIGGMVETELAMTVSASLAAGLGGFRFVDLDTPLFMAERPLKGGFRRTGAHLDLSLLDSGHGVSFLGA